MAKKQSQAAAEEAANANHEADSSKIAADIHGAENDKPPTKSGGDNSAKPPPVHHRKKVVKSLLWKTV